MESKKVKEATRMICIILIYLFAICASGKTFQNDTFFMIRIGNKILDQGFYTEETFSWHEGLTYANVKWAFDVSIATLYNNFGFTGIYVFVLCLSIFLGLGIFYILNKRRKNFILNFIFTTLILYYARGGLAARPQIASYIIFVFQIYFIEQLLETNKKRYSLYIILLAIIMANVHGSIFPMYLIGFMPYVAEIFFAVIRKFLRKHNYINNDVKEEGKYIINDYKTSTIILFLVTMAISSVCCVISPTGNFRMYKDMFDVTNSIANNYIGELSALVPDSHTIWAFIMVLSVAITGFTKAKIKITDALFILGFGILSLSAFRNLYYFIIIGGISLARIINDTLEAYDIDKIKVSNRLKNAFIVFLFLIVLIYVSKEILLKVDDKYLNENRYCPVGAADFLINNYDLNEIRLYNGFNIGAYLEFREIPVFIDSRPEVYKGTTVLKDNMDVLNMNCDYNTIFDKYKITHLLINKNERVSAYLPNDSKWDMVYSDERYTVYERVRLE